MATAVVPLPSMSSNVLRVSRSQQPEQHLRSVVVKGHLRQRNAVRIRLAPFPVLLLFLLIFERRICGKLLLNSLVAELGKKALL